MFRGLLPPPPTTSSAYIDLQRKVDEHARKPRVHNFHRVDPVAALARIGILEARICESLAWFERWTADPDHRSSAIRRTWHRSRVDEAMVEIRRLVHALTLRRAVRLVACVRIQRACLRLLYRPATRPGQVPKISRLLLDETFMALGNGDADSDG